MKQPTITDTVDFSEAESVDMDVDTSDSEVLSENLWDKTGQRFSILFVDDDSRILDLLNRTYLDSGYSIFRAESADLAMQILADESIDVVVSDLRMPDMSGVEFLRGVRAKYPRIRRIMMSGYFDINDTINAINENQLFGYIIKPWDNKKLKMTIYKALISKKHEDDERANRKERNQRAVQIARRFGSEIRQLKKGSGQAYDDATALFKKLSEMRIEDHEHGQRVSDLSVKIARQMGADDVVCEQLAAAGQVHDIGCMLLSEREQSLPFSELNVREQENFRSHAVLGERMISGLKTYASAARMIRNHHEHFDGSGYPDGLKEEEIPLGARIIKVASDYDDLAFRKQESRKMSVDVILRRFKTHMRRRYDPAVVNALEIVLTQPVKS